jgi:serpin B
MAQVGAGGETATELAGALGMGDDITLYQHAFGGFLQDLDLAPLEEGCYTTETSAAQAAFLRSDLTLQEAFANQILGAYGAAPQALEAEDPVGQINGWVDTETQGHIPSLLSQGQITPDTALVLVNAVYFRGDWAQPFESPVDRGVGLHEAGRLAGVGRDDGQPRGGRVRGRTRRGDRRRATWSSSRTRADRCRS